MSTMWDVLYPEGDMSYKDADVDKWVEVTLEDQLEQFARDSSAPTIMDSYEDVITNFAQWPAENSEEYLTYGLMGEVGEVMSAYAKYNRGDFDEEELTNRLGKELGDILFFVVMLAKHEGFTITELLTGNVDKLLDRFNNGTIKGDGDNR